MSKQSVKPKPVKDSFVGIPIERGIPMPPKQAQKTGPRTPISVAMHKLKVGESFAVPLEQKKRLGIAASTCRKRTGAKFAVRELDGFARVWRLS